MLRKPLALLKKFFNFKPPKVTLKLPSVADLKPKSQEELEGEAKRARYQKLQYLKYQVRSKYQLMKIKRWRAKKKMGSLTRRRQRA